MGGNYLTSPIASQSKQMGDVMEIWGYWTLPLTPFNADIVVYDLLNALWQYAWLKRMVPLKVSDGQRWKTGPRGSRVCVCVCVFVGTLKNKRGFAKLCRTLFPNTGCFTLCLLLQTEGTQKRSCSTGMDRSTFRPRTDLKQPDKVLALFFPLSFMVHPSACQRSVSFSLSFSPL